MRDSDDTPRRRPGDTVTGWICLGVGGLGLFASLGLAARSAWRLATNERAVGSVRLVGHGTKGSVFFSVSYPGGTLQERDRMAWLGGSSWHDGDRVAVLHPKDAPADGVVHCFKNLWLGPVLVGGIGLGLVSTGLGFRALAPKAEEDPENPNLTADQLVALDLKRLRKRGRPARRPDGESPPPRRRPRAESE